MYSLRDGYDIVISLEDSIKTSVIIDPGQSDIVRMEKIAVHTDEHLIDVTFVVRVQHLLICIPVAVVTARYCGIIHVLQNNRCYAEHNCAHEQTCDHSRQRETSISPFFHACPAPF